MFFLSFPFSLLPIRVLFVSFSLLGTFAVVSLMVSNAVTNVLESDSIYSPCANLSVEQYRDYDVPELNMTCEEVIVSIAVSVTFATGFLMVRCSIHYMYMYTCIIMYLAMYVSNSESQVFKLFSIFVKICIF